MLGCAVGLFLGKNQKLRESLKDAEARCDDAWIENGNLIGSARKEKIIHEWNGGLQ